MFDIITDSACDLTPDTAKQLGVEVVPFYVSLDGEHYRKEGKEITVRDFYQFMVDNPAAYPKTSLASIEDFETAFRAHAAAGRDVLCLVFTGKMSGCVGSARNARAFLPTMRWALSGRILPTANSRCSEPGGTFWKPCVWCCRMIPRSGPMPSQRSLPLKSLRIYYSL